MKVVTDLEVFTDRLRIPKVNFNKETKKCGKIFLESKIFENFQEVYLLYQHEHLTKPEN